MVDGIPLSGGWEFVSSALAADTALGGYTRRRFDEILGRFALFCVNGFGVSSVEDISPECIAAFVNAPIKNGRAPQIATMHLRRSALRYFFRVAIQLGLCETDPTWGLALPPRTSAAFRALTDDELVLCRSFSQHTLTATRQPAAWALAEATGTTSELPHITIADIDLVLKRVWLHGSNKTFSRFGYLSEWGWSQLEQRVKHFGKKASPETRLIYAANGADELKQRSACLAISETLVRAGLGGEQDIRPSSVVAWAGQQIFAETNDIVTVAHRLGMRSLDRAAKFIGYDWQANE